jgi:glycosyltransferase involved in cell wall biosynthesis
MRYLRTLVNTAVYLARLVWLIPRHDVVHVFSASYAAFLLVPVPALVLAKLFKKKTVLNYHSGEAEDHLRRSRLAVRLCRLADAIAVPSDYLVGVFGRFGLRATAIPNVVDTGRFAFRPRTVGPRFLAARSLEPLYGLPCILHAFAEIQRTVPEAHLTVAGDGSQRAALGELARELALNNVVFLGAVPPERMPAVYDACDIFLNASSIDNMPVSLLEAFASGLPVVTTDAGGIPYIVTDRQTGLLVPKNDSGALARAALSLVAHPAFASQLARAARTQCEQYSLANAVRAWLALYQALLGRSVTPAAGIPSSDASA